MAEVIQRVRPVPVGTYLANPHRGCCTFQHFNGDPLYPGTSWDECGPTEFPPARFPVDDGYVPTTVAYCRWFWEIFEPEEGRYDFTVIERALQTCQQRGQTLAIRLMAFGSAGQTPVPAWYAKKYPMVENLEKGKPFSCPDQDHPVYLERFGGLIRECGRRFNSHPLLESVDMAYIGAWGEGGGGISLEQSQRFVQTFTEAFPDVPRLALIGDPQGRLGVESGSGWRWDGYGMIRPIGSKTVEKPNSWMGMYDGVPFTLRKAGMAEAWRTAPVHFETWGVPLLWSQLDWDIDFILQQGLKYHCTYFMPKYTAIPGRWRDRIEAFIARLGYNFVFRHACFDAAVRVGGSLQFKAWIENTGVAPIYRPYRFALRFRQKDAEEIVPLADVDVRTWLPGDATIEQQVRLPQWIKPGYVRLAAGLIDPRTQQARVSFACREEFGDRWLSLAGFEVE